MKLGFVVLIVRIPEEPMTLANTDHPKDQEKWGLDPCHDCQRLKCGEDCTLVTKTSEKVSWITDENLEYFLKNMVKWDFLGVFKNNVTWWQKLTRYPNTQAH